jgi:hypothetical protein
MMRELKSDALMHEWSKCVYVRANMPGEIGQA